MARKSRGTRIRLGTIRVLPSTATVLEAHRLSSHFSSLGDVLDELAALRMDRDAAMQAAHHAANQAEMDRRAAVVLAGEWEQKLRKEEEAHRQTKLGHGLAFVPVKAPRRRNSPRVVASQSSIDGEPPAVQYLIRSCRNNKDSLGKVVAGLRGGYRGPPVLDALRAASAEHLLALLGVNDGA